MPGRVTVVRRAVTVVVAAGAVVLALGAVRGVPSSGVAAADAVLVADLETRAPTQTEAVTAAVTAPRATDDDATVGALFPDGLSGAHTCTASVVASASGDLLLTAAHCISGSPAGWLFVPDYDDASMPEGVWTVTGAYVDRAWMSEQNPSDDVAVLTVAPRTVGGRSVPIQDVTGANTLGSAPANGTKITDVAYNDGTDTPRVCTTTTYTEDGYPAFNCDDYVGGSSGSPWLTTTASGTSVVGVIGGLNQGGCSPDTSYSIGFGIQVARLVARADAGGTGDDVPAAGSDGC